MPTLILDFADRSQLDPAMARSLADAAADILGIAPGHCWLRMRALEAYAENGADSPPRPVFVEILRDTLPRREQLQEESRQLAAAFAARIGCPVDLVHVIHAPAGSGRVAFGGRLIP